MRGHGTIGDHISNLKALFHLLANKMYLDIGFFTGVESSLLLYKAFPFHNAH